MKTGKLKPFKIILLTLGLLLAIALIFLAKPLYQISQMNPLETGEVIKGVYALRNGNVNMFLVPIGDKYMAIDAGSNEQAVKEGLDTLRIAPSDVTVILLTHPHFDHVAALNLFDNATVYMGNGDLPDGVSLPSKQMSDGEVAEISGHKIKAIHTPGHHDSSVVFIMDDKIMFSGDNFSLIDGRVDLFVSIFNADDRQQEDDIRKLAGIQGIEHIFTAHHGYAEGPMVLK